MHPEHSDMAQFLARHPPFQDLPHDALQRLAAQIEVSYYKAGRDILLYGDPIADLYVIRSGAVEIFRRNGELYNQLAEGGIFGQMGLMMNRRVRFPARALEDTLLYCIPLTYYEAYCDEYETFADYFEAEQEGVLRHALSTEFGHSDLSTVKVAKVVRDAPPPLSPDTSVQHAAQCMTEWQISALLITPPDTGSDHRPLLGIITDSDLRSRVLAEGLSANTPVGEVMTASPRTIDSESYLFEAMLAMLRDNVHHMPVITKTKATGILSLSDILQHESQNSLLYVRAIFSHNSIAALSEHAERLPAVYQRLINEDANSQMVGKAMSVIGRSFCQQLLMLAETELGPPPVAYCFMSLGSMAREEQTLVTDQDNALILHDDYDAQRHGPYFEQLSTWVCQALAQCGYPLCEGNIMAQNPQWRLTLSQWQAQFQSWLEKPEPQALLNSNIFFDLDAVWGEESLAHTLRAYIAEHAPKHPAFLACLARNALNRTPPLGFFKGFVVEPDGEYRNTMNLKRRGTAPLTDVVRVHALATGSQAQNSFERLQDIAQTGLLPEGKSREMADALEYLSITRMRHQAEALAQGRKPDNQLNPNDLSAFERRSLKAAFQVLDNAQKFLKFRYTAQQAIR